MTETSPGQPPVRVGIIGLSASGGFAAGAHVPALRALDGYELRGCSASSPESAAAAAAKHDVPLSFGSAEELAASDEIDLVVVTVKTPYHYELVMTALQAGKMVLCEWPLGNGSAQSAELATEASRRGLRTAVGLQARSAPWLLYLRDLVAGGYVGEVLSTTIIGSGLSYGAQCPPAARYSIDAANGATMLSIPMGHTLDAACLVLGEFTDFTATLATRRPVVHDTATGEALPMSVPDQVAVSGRLENGAVASVHYRGGLSRATNLHWEINGTEGDLVVTGPSGHLQLADVQIRGARAADDGLARLEVPEKYELVPGAAGQSARVANVAHAYAQLLEDIQTGSSVVPTFEHAARRHAMLDAIAAADQR
jgi:predicted dehydrogenase